MDSDDEVIPAGRGAGDEPELELDDLLEQPASEAQEPRLSRLKRKVDAGDDAPVKTKKRTAVLDSPLVSLSNERARSRSPRAAWPGFLSSPAADRYVLSPHRSAGHGPAQDDGDD